MNVKNEMPTGRISCTKGRPTFSPREFDAFETFERDEQYDDVLSFANHHTYDGNTHQSLDDYFARVADTLAPA